MRVFSYFLLLFVLLCSRAEAGGKAARCLDFELLYQQNSEIFSGIAEKDGSDASIRINEVFKTDTGTLKTGEHIDVSAKGFEGFDSFNSAHFIKGKEFIIYGTSVKGQETVVSNGSSALISAEDLVKYSREDANINLGNGYAISLIGSERIYFIGTVKDIRKRERHFGYEADFEINELLRNSSRFALAEGQSNLTVDMYCAKRDPKSIIGKKYMVVASPSNRKYTAIVWDLDEKTILRKLSPSK